MPEKYNNDFEIFRKDENFFGRSFSYWIDRWWNWLVSIPKDRNPALDSTGEHADENQRYELFFLAGKDGKAERRCVIPLNKPIFFPITATQATLAKYNTYPSKLLEIAKSKQNNVKEMKLKIDNILIQGLDNFRMVNDGFTLTVPFDNILNLPSGTTQAVSDGRWILLRFLHASEHVIEFVAREVEPDVITKVTYHLTIK